nr:hypothetical protein [Mycoplasmopsis bovis]
MPTSATILNIVPTTNKTKYFWFGAIIARLKLAELSLQYELEL